MEILDRYRQLVTDRSQWLNTYQEVGKYVWPDARTMVKSTQVADVGQVLTVDISDSTAIKASRRMTAGIFSYLMPVGVKWFELKPADKRLEMDKGIQRKLSAAVDFLHGAILRSNFQREMFMTIRSLVVFGTGRSWPDLVVAGVMAALAISGGWSVVRQARQELAHASKENQPQAL